MSHLKTNAQIFMVMALAAVTLVLLSIFIGAGVQPQTVAAQGPVATVVPAPMVISQEDYNRFKQALGSLQAAAGTTFNLQISKKANVTSVLSGAQVTFTITITNATGSPAYGVVFQDDIPPEMSNVSYNFGSLQVVSNGQPNPIWMFKDPILANQSISFTISGKLTTARRVRTMVNVAKVSLLEVAFGNPTQMQTAQAAVVITNPASTDKVVYLPFVQTQPTPTPSPTPPVVLAYSEDFSDRHADNAWVEFSANDCEAKYSSGQYWVTLDAKGDNACLPPANKKAYRTYGEFQVTAYQSGDWKNSGAYGLFINGEGGDNYYLFRIWANISGCSNGGKWELIRRKSGKEQTLASNSCDPAIKRGYDGSSATNILKIRHTSNAQLSIYINNLSTPLKTITESSSNHLDGTATGVYAYADDKDARFKYDNFKVYKIP